MIEMPNEASIREHQRLQKARIFEQFRHDEPEKVAKSVTTEEFSKEYAGRKFYSEQSIQNFKNDFMKSEDADSALMIETLKGLEKVSVDGVTFYVDQPEG